MALSVSEINERISDAIQSHGWWVQSVLPDRKKSSFSYTVGLTETFEHPEILMMGHDPRMMHGLLNDIGALIRAGDRFEEWSTSDKVIAGYSVVFRSVPKRDGRTWSLAADARYDDYKLLQVFLPDPDGRFPWDPKCDKKTAKLQGALLSAMPKRS